MKTLSSKESKEKSQFPLEHYSYSIWVKFSSNPLMFKVNAINGEYIETTSTASSVLGSAVHKALQTYFGGNPDMPVMDEADATKTGYEVGLAFLNAYSDGLIEYTATIPTRTKLEEKYSFCYFGFLKEQNGGDIKDILIVDRELKHRIEVDGKIMPVPLKGHPDLVYKDAKGRIKIRDPKFCYAYSKNDEIDGNKLIQAAFYYFLVYAETGQEPYSMTFQEFKTSANQDKSKQLREYEIVYKDAPLIFDLFFRFYEDITDALLGKQVYVPNLQSMYDKEVSLLAYIHRLDMSEEVAQKLKDAKVDNITDFLKQKIQTTGSMKKYLDVVSKKFISAKSLNYKDMTTEDKIKMKLAEHGIAMDFDSKVTGGSVTLYRYEPSIGLKMSRIEGYTKDIEQVVETAGIRILAPIPGTGLVGFEVPNKERTFPTKKPKAKGFEIAIGEDVIGNPYYLDIREMPHMLVAGATGSGKSVFLNSVIRQLKDIPNSELILIDPKMVELAQWQNIATEYADDPQKTTAILMGLVKEMDARYKILKGKKAKNISEITGMDYKFVVIDEFADLITRVDGIRTLILLLAQKARAAGIHLIITTQRPSVKIIDGDIKANFPTRVAFRTSSSIDSRVILDEDGSEKLMGKGDLLIKTHDAIVRLQGYSN